MQFHPLAWLHSRAHRIVLGCLTLCAFSIGTVYGADATTDPASQKETALLDGGDGWSYIGQIQPRHARDIEGSNWSVGAETMDRDFTIYANWRKYLGPLGIKKARIQSGWAKTEKTPGEYDWAWLDEIIPDMAQQGVEPWVCICYGNPIYPGGGGTGLGGKLIEGETALSAWERYITTFVKRYGQYVNEWEIWNEPRGGRGEAAAHYADLVILAAETIRKLQPDAEILFAAGGSFDIRYAEDVLKHLKEQGNLHLVNRIIYHPYAYNPDSRQESAMKLRALAKSYADHIDIRQGENGAPSKAGSFGAIAKHDWTELRQAKWATRRLLGDLGHDVPSSYFAICDMAYPTRVNYKGLLAIDDNKAVEHVKEGYHAVQHIAAIFDNSLSRVEDCEVTLGDVNADNYSVFTYRNHGGGGVVTVWRDTDRPGDNPAVEQIDVTISGLKLEQPVLVDLVSGRVYAVHPKLVERSGKTICVHDVPVYDSVVVLAERSVIEKVMEEAAIE